MHIPQLLIYAGEWVRKERSRDTRKHWSIKRFDKNRFHATWSAIGNTKFNGVLEQARL